MEVCKHCGTPTTSPDAVCDSCRNRSITLEKMYEFYNQFQKSREHLQAINNMNNELWNLKNTRPQTNWSSFWIIWILCGSVGGLIGLFILAILMEISEVTSALIGFLGMVVVTVVFVLSFERNTKKNNVIKLEFNTWRDSQIKQLDEMISNEYEKIHNLYNQTNKYIPEQYSDLNTVTSLIQLVESSRADSLKDAINLYESIKHTDEMLRLQQQMSRNTKISAMANVVSAVANVETAINTR